MWNIFGLIIGAAVGSFLNVVIYRLPKKGLKIWDPFYSFCPHCKHPLSALDNIPIISYLLLKGKCRYCGNRIPIRYFIVEVSNAAFYFLAPFLTKDALTLIALCGIFSTLLAISFVDIETWHVHDALLISLLIFSLIFAFENNTLFNALVSEVVGLGIFYLLYKLKKGLGFGDVLLIGASAFTMEPYVLNLSILISAASGILVSVVIYKGFKPKKAIPFTPFLSIGIIFGLIFTIFRG